LGVKEQAVETEPALNMSKPQAISAARKSLDERKISRSGLYEVISLSADSSFPSQYVFEHGGYPKARQLWKSLNHGYTWDVHFFRPMQSEEYDVCIAGDTGKEYSFSI